MMRRLIRTFLILKLLLVAISSRAVHPLPTYQLVRSYVQQFNEADDERYVNTFDNSKAAQFLEDNIPILECPDKELERTYYFRWWTYRKHVKQTPEGYIITEFLPPVGWAQKFNAIPCPGEHHVNEGRWLRNDVYVRDYLRFWLTSEGVDPRKYSFPIAHAAWKFYQVHPDAAFLTELYPLLCENFNAWNDHYDTSRQLYWQTDNRDGMECSVSGYMDAKHEGYRTTINSYMYADAEALSNMAKALGKKKDSRLWHSKALGIRQRMNEMLWDADAHFYKVLPRRRDTLSDARELHGYVPWVYNIPEKEKGEAWEQLFDTLGFAAPYGPTTVERRHPGFSLSRKGHECKWNGPSWPFATSQTLTAMAQCIQRYGEKFITREQYLQQLLIFSHSHRLGKNCFIDEDLDPFTGEWIARSVLKSWGDKIPDRGKDYNHSTFADLVISGLLGVSPRMNGTLEVKPLLPPDAWDYWCLRNVPCGGNLYTIIYDKSGQHYGQGKGLMVKMNPMPTQ